MALVAEDVKAPARRRYTSAVRAEQAAATRRAVLAAARELFTEQGYAATSITADRAPRGRRRRHRLRGGRAQARAAARAGRDGAVRHRRGRARRGARLRRPDPRRRLGPGEGRDLRVRGRRDRRPDGAGAPGARRGRADRSRLRRAAGRDQRPPGGQHAAVRRRPAGDRRAAARPDRRRGRRHRLEHERRRVPRAAGGRAGLDAERFALLARRRLGPGCCWPDRRVTSPAGLPGAVGRAPRRRRRATGGTAVSTVSDHVHPAASLCAPAEQRTIGLPPEHGRGARHAGRRRSGQSAWAPSGRGASRGTTRCPPGPPRWRRSGRRAPAGRRTAAPAVRGAQQPLGLGQRGRARRRSGATSWARTSPSTSASGTTRSTRPPAAAVVGVEHLAGEHQPVRHVRHHPRQHDGGDDRRHEPDPHLGEGERRRRRRRRRRRTRPAARRRRPAPARGRRRPPAWARTRSPRSSSGNSRTPWSCDAAAGGLGEVHARSRTPGRCGRARPPARRRRRARRRAPSRSWARIARESALRLAGESRVSVATPRDTVDLHHTVGGHSRHPAGPWRRRGTLGADEHRPAAAAEPRPPAGSTRPRRAARERPRRPATHAVRPLRARAVLRDPLRLLRLQHLHLRRARPRRQPRRSTPAPRSPSCAGPPRPSAPTCRRSPPSSSAAAPRRCCRPTTSPPSSPRSASCSRWPTTSR